MQFPRFPFHVMFISFHFLIIFHDLENPKHIHVKKEGLITFYTIQIKFYDLTENGRHCLRDALQSKNHQRRQLFTTFAFNELSVTFWPVIKEGVCGQK